LREVGARVFIAVIDPGASAVMAGLVPAIHAAMLQNRRLAKAMLRLFNR
jgi:hypothetical protein